MLNIHADNSRRHYLKIFARIIHTGENTTLGGMSQDFPGSFAPEKTQPSSSVIKQRRQPQGLQAGNKATGDSDTFSKNISYSCRHVKAIKFRQGSSLTHRRHASSTPCYKKGETKLSANVSLETKPSKKLEGKPAEEQY